MLKNNLHINPLGSVVLEQMQSKPLEENATASSKNSRANLIIKFIAKCAFVTLGVLLSSAAVGAIGFFAFGAAVPLVIPLALAGGVAGGVFILTLYVTAKKIHSLIFQKTKPNQEKGCENSLVKLKESPRCEKPANRIDDLVDSEPVLKIKLAHGTKASTLVMMNRESPHKHQLVSFKKLKEVGSVCFAGELGKGIGDNGVNQQGTSWTTSVDVGIDYANEFTFNLDRIKTKFFDIIQTFNECVKTNHQNFQIPALVQADPSEFNLPIAQIKQLRAHDEKDYQNNYKQELIHWAQYLIKDYKEVLNEPNKFLINESRRAKLGCALEKAEELLEVLTQPLILELTEKEKKLILENIPIMFASTTETGDLLEGKNSLKEVIIQKPMLLGKDIQIIATPERHVAKISEFVNQMGLSLPVEVVSMESLRNRSWKVL